MNFLIILNEINQRSSTHGFTNIEMNKTVFHLNDKNLLVSYFDNIFAFQTHMIFEPLSKKTPTCVHV